MHTLGTLLENPQYKRALSEGNLGALLSGFVDGLTGGNPLEKGGPGGYESLNRDSGKNTTLAAYTRLSAIIQRSKSVEHLFRPTQHYGMMERHGRSCMFQQRMCFDR